MNRIAFLLHLTVTKKSIGKRILALTFCLFTFQTSFGQNFQKLYSYHDPGGVYPAGVREGGGFKKVHVLDPNPSGIQELAAIGMNYDYPNDVLVSVLAPDGSVINFTEFKEVAGNEPTGGMAISQLPTGDMIACIFSPSSFATHVVRLTTNGTVIWVQKIPDFFVWDVECARSANLGIDGIWMSGQSVYGTMAMACLTSGGTLQFANHYGISHPMYNYNDVIGYELEFDPIHEHIMMVGKGQTFYGLDDMIVMRTDNMGNEFWTRSYGNQTEEHFYRGKALTPHGKAPGNFAVSFEYSEGPQPEQDMGIMQIDMAGNIAWINSYSGPRGFSGTNFKTQDIVGDDKSFMTVGQYDEGLPNQPIGYSISIRKNGDARSLTTYQSATVYPAYDTRLMTVDYHPDNDQMVLGGMYKGVANTAGWPLGPDPRSFWMIQADTHGPSECSDSYSLEKTPLNPEVTFLEVQQVAYSRLVPGTLTWTGVNDSVTTQCYISKRGDLMEEVSDSGMQVNYVASQNQLRIFVEDSELTGDIQLVDMQGRMISERIVPAGETMFSTEQISKGIYLVRYTLSNGVGGTQKVMIH